VKPAAFEYSAPATLDEAIEALSHDDAKVLAGGQSLIPLMAMRLSRFDRLVDLRKIPELSGCVRVDGAVRIGAMTRQADAEHDPVVAVGAPLIAKALPNVGHVQIRNRGTVGGSIVHADPSAELPTVTLALDATVEIAGASGVRRVPAAEFFLGTMETAVGEHEIVTAIEFPVWGPGSGFAVEEIARRHGDFALVGAMCGVRVSAGAVVQSAVAMFGVGSAPVRCRAAETSLAGASVEGLDLADIARLAVADLEPPDDLHASGAYRRAVGAALVERALRAAIEEAAHA
jgi:carbon-monoxide dehydrogenase medium subunit